MIYEAFFNGHRVEVDADEHVAERGLYRCFTLDPIHGVHLTGYLAYNEPAGGAPHPEFLPDHIHRTAASGL